DSIRPAWYRQDLAQVPPDKSLYDITADLRPMWNRGAIQSHLGAFGFSGDTVLRRAGSLSGGERARMALSMMVLDNANLLIFDEPTNHLDVESIEVLEDALGAWGGTVLLVSHDRALLEALVTRVWVLHNARITDYPGTFVEWEEASREREHAAAVAAAEDESSRRVEERKRTRRGDDRAKDERAALRAEQAERRARGDKVQLGIGVSTFTEMCGLAPSRVLGSLSYGAGGWEHASVRMLPTGKVEVVTGSSAHGQGHETAWSQIVSDKLGVPFEDVEVLHGDTQVAHKGLDTYGSRSLVVGAEAVIRAADKVIEKARVVAAHLLEASVEDIDFANGSFTVRGTDSAKAMAEVVWAAFSAHNLPDGFEPNLDSEATYDPVNFSFPH
ncbi:molybdopterin cofactor-binding domain-containing protein, partial [Phycicoccus elongatus]|uniref:molybdopterin cofactor-binding domain-containing protein n=1 Tax=Phycicoccus elongatus TaxID=101689 RepID=UPI003783BAEF